MLKVGERNISEMYLGAGKIGKAYVGEELVFGEEAAPSRLPEGYTELAYVENSRSARNEYSSGLDIYGNVIGKMKFEFDLFIVPNDTGYNIDQYLLRASKSASTNNTLSFYVAFNWYKSNTKIGLKARLGVYSWSSIDIPFPQDGGNLLITVDAISGILTINGMEYSGSEQSGFSQGYPSLLMSTRISGWSSNMYPRVRAKNIKLYTQDGTLVRDWVPAIQQSTEKVGFYDVVNDKFSASNNNTTYPFIAGPAV